MTTTQRPTWNPTQGGQDQGSNRQIIPTRQYSAKDQPAHTKLKYRNPEQSEPKRLSLPAPKNVELPEDSSSEDSSDNINEEELLAELEKIKKEREEAKAAKEEEKRLKAKQDRDHLLQANPLLNVAPGYAIKRKWTDDTIFQNQARDEPKEQKRFINDTVRSDFHKKFMNRFVHQKFNKMEESQVEQIIKKHFDTENIPERCLSYMAGMVIEDPPSNPTMLKSLLQDFLLDGYRISEEQAAKSCEAMYKELQDTNLGHKDQLQRLVAEIMPSSVMMKNVGIDTEFITSNYIDPILGIQKANINYNRSKQPKAPVRKTEENKDISVELRSFQRQLPPPRVNHNRGESRSLDIIVDRYSLVIGGKTLLDGAQIKLAYGRRYGLVGRNGIGKTCLLSALAAGEIEKVPKYISILYVEQEIVGTTQTVLQTLLDTDVERNELLEQEQKYIQENDVEKLEKIVERLQEIESDSAESRAASILNSLGFTQEMLGYPTNALSGGWRMRVALARALYARPDVLLLDEPTNHLDLETCIWLENYLNTWQGTLVVVSHARDFLNNVSTDVIHFFNESLTYYKGNYEQFEVTRKRKQLHQQRAHDAQQAKIDHMQTFINRFRCNANRAALVQSRLKAIKRMDIIGEVLDDPTQQFILPNVDKLSPPLLRIDDGTFSYGQNLILEEININVDTNSRIALLGRNGCGKSTLLKIFTGELELTSGSSFRHRRMRLGLFTQHHVDSLDLSASPLEQMAATFPGTTHEVIRNHLGSFGITGNLALRPMCFLSGGQKSRVALASIAFRCPHAILLDEPTNHLDLDAVNALIIALNAYGGGLVIVSHDQHFVSAVCDEIFVIRRMKVKRFNGSFLEYRKSLRL